MEILSLNIKNNDKLGDLYLDFSNNDVAANCIVIAGDNGTGKSTILKIIEELFSFYSLRDGWNCNISLKFKFSSIDEKSKFFDNLELEKMELLQAEKEEIIKYKFEEQFYINRKISNGQHYHTEFSTSSEHSERWGSELFVKLSNIINVPIVINNDTVSLPSHVKNISDSELNSASNFGVKNEQLLVDINNQDNSDFVKSQPRELEVGYIATKSNVDNYKKRISIFTNAFNTFFNSNNLSFKEIDSKHKILFEKYGKEFSIENFSKGENQIFNMACQILKNSHMFGNIIIIDEPENGLHPEWQLKLLNYYRELANGKQIIISTHSPFIINSLLTDDKLLILKREKDVIKVDQENQYYSIGEVGEISKGMKLTEPQDDQIIIYVGGITDKKYLKKTIELWKEEVLELKKIKIIYPFTLERGGNGGDANLLKQYHSHFSIIDNWCFLFDHDVETKIRKKVIDLKNCKIMLLTEEIKKFSNFGIQSKENLSGIENFIKIKKREITPFLKDTTTTTRYGGEIINKHKSKKEPNKNNICENMMGLPTNDLKFRLQKLKDFLVNTFINTHE